MIKLQIGLETFDIRLFENSYKMGTRLRQDSTEGIYGSALLLLAVTVRIRANKRIVIFIQNILSILFDEVLHILNTTLL